MNVREYNKILKEQKEPQKPPISLKELKKKNMLNLVNDLRCAGLKTRQIAEELNCDTSTVSRYLRKIKELLECQK